MKRFVEFLTHFILFQVLNSESRGTNGSKRGQNLCLMFARKKENTKIKWNLFLFCEFLIVKVFVVWAGRVPRVMFAIFTAAGSVSVVAAAVVWRAFWLRCRKQLARFCCLKDLKTDFEFSPFVIGRFSPLTLQPFDLRRWAVALLVPTRDPEDDRRLRGHVDVRGFYRFGRDVALILLSHVHARERELIRLRRVRILHGEVHAVLGDFARQGARRLPRKMRAVGGLWDFDAGWCSGEARQAGFERRRLGRKRESKPKVTRRKAKITSLNFPTPHAFTPAIRKR